MVWLVDWMVGQALPHGAAEDSVDLLPLLLDPTLDTPLRRDLIHHSVHGHFAVRQALVEPTLLRFSIVTFLNESVCFGEKSSRVFRALAPPQMPVSKPHVDDVHSRDVPQCVASQ